MKNALGLTVSLLALGLVSSLASAQKVTLEYATWDATRQKTDEALIAAFEKANPTIDVKYNLVPWGVYWQKAAAMTAGGSTFDVMWMNLDNFPFYQSQGALAPLSVPEKSLSGINKNMIDPYRVGGKLYGVPLGPQAVTVFINRQLFKERGVAIPTNAWTWEQMLDAAKKLTFEKDGKKIWGINAQDLQVDLEYGMSFYYSNGGKGIIKKSGNTFKANLDRSFSDTAQKLSDLIYKHKVSAGPADIGQQGYQQFLAGQVGIFVEGSWMVPVWSQNPDLDWAYAPFPSLQKGKAAKPVFSAHALVVPAGSKNKEAASKLIEWLNTSTQAQRMIAQKGLLPTLADQYKTQYLQALPGRNAGVVFDQLKNSVIINSDVRNLSNLPEVLTALNTSMNLVWTGNAKVTDAVKNATRDMQDLLNQGKVIGSN